MTPPVLAKVEHATIREIPDHAPDLPFGMAYGPGAVFRAAIRTRARPSLSAGANVLRRSLNA